MAEFAAPLIMLGVGMIGSWLFAPKNEDQNDVFDSGAEEMPRINQSLRGATMAVVFGTMRVPSHIVWTKNWTVIRNETEEDTGGGGKFGGSGLKGPTSGGTTEVTYEYKWDLMYHCGMVPEEYHLVGGWLGDESINGATLAAIRSGGGNETLVFGEADTKDETFGLSFDDAFFGSGGPTGSTGFSNWDHFEDEEDTVARFPWTTYIGFKQLNLGGSARLPQLSWEIGPGDVDIDFSAGYLTSFTRPNALSNDAGDPSTGFIRSVDDTVFHVTGWDNGFHVGPNVFEIININTGAILDSRTSAEFQTDADNEGLDPGANYDFTFQNVTYIIDQKYILQMAVDIGSGTRTNQVGVLYEVDNSGQVTSLGGYQLRSEILASQVTRPKAGGRWGQQTDNDPILVGGVSQVGLNNSYIVHALPTINEMKAVGGYVVDDGTLEWDKRMFDLSTTAAGDQWCHNISYLGDEVFGFQAGGMFLNTAVVTPFGVSWKSRIYFYVEKARVQKHIDDPSDIDASDRILDLMVERPNGWMEYLNLFWNFGTQTLTGDAALTLDNDAFVTNRGGETVLPWADGLLDLDGTTEDLSDDYDPSPTTMLIKAPVAAGATLIIWSKYQMGAEDSTGMYVKVKAMIWNPFTFSAKLFGEIEGPAFDSVTDLGASEINRHNFTIGSFRIWLDEKTNTIYYHTTTIGGDGAFDDQDHIGTIGTLEFGGGSVDLYPPFIIRTIIEHEAFGLNRNAVFDEAAYAAALQYCADQDIKVSTIYNRESAALQVIDQLLAVYGGYLHDSAGIIKFGLQDFGNDPRTIDNDHLVSKDGGPPVRVTLAGKQDGYNRIKINYLDRKIQYRQNMVEVEDPVDQDFNGVRAREFPPQFVMSEKTALKMAVRALWNNLYGRDTYNFKLGPKDSDLEPGSVITLIDSFHPQLKTGVQARIIDWRETSRMQFDVTAVKEIQYISSAEVEVNSSTLASSNPLFGPTAVPAQFRMYELPREFSLTTGQVFVGYNQWKPAMGAFLYLSSDGESFAKSANAQPYIISGQLSHALPNRPVGYVEQGTRLLLMPASNYTVNTPTFAQSHTLDDVSGPSRAAAQGNICIGSEICAYQGLTLLSQNFYKVDKLFRGWGGTHIQGHSSGDYWHKHGSGIFARDITIDNIGNLVHYKVVPYTFAGQEADVSSVVAQTYQIQGMFWRPQNAPQPSLFVDSTIGHTDSTDLQGFQFIHVHSTGTNFTLQWPDSARQGGHGVGGFGTGTYGRFTTDTTSHQYRVEVLSKDLTTVVRCTVVSTGFFVYSRDINSTDFNGWQGDLQIQITPFNDLGDAPRTRVHRLTLFEEA